MSPGAGRPQRKAVSAALCAWEQFGGHSAAEADCAPRCGVSSLIADESVASEQQQQQQQQRAPPKVRKRQQREVNALLAVIGRFKASGKVQTEDPADQAKARTRDPSSITSSMLCHPYHVVRCLGGKLTGGTAASCPSLLIRWCRRSDAP